MQDAEESIVVAGRTIARGALEVSLLARREVAECAILLVHTPTTGDLLLALVVPCTASAADPAALCESMTQTLRDQHGLPPGSVRVAVVPRLPRTGSGKFMREVVRRVAEGHEARPPAALDDPSALEALREALHDIGLPPAPPPT